ncbi:olfactory receptor 52L1-like [Chelonoidis abingdonii]|uniref:olfactory receptor 52L1-like n=1 Tax=Chelonoidis abingdonii TaxID=106734 RepID=UPI0013F26141|nr:olfactory receptor 52L1-like [Chelonoidis abingdonii]
MSPINNGSLRPPVFLLVGIPGLESMQHWPHRLATLPKMLSVFWLGERAIKFHACFTQKFFVHASSLVESGILVAMALDHYVTICNPLWHADILKISMVAKIALLVLVRGLIVISPFPLLLMDLPFCQAYIIPHSYCEHMALVKLACADTMVNATYNVVMTTLVVGMDGMSIVVSYVVILWAVFILPSTQARLKALRTCMSHICVILMFYFPGLFSFLEHRLGQSVPLPIHILLANLYILLPPMQNPIVYKMKTKQIRNQVTRVFHVRGP